jgi:hypothetical protein
LPSNVLSGLKWYSHRTRTPGDLAGVVGDEPTDRVGQVIADERRQRMIREGFQARAGIPPKDQFQFVTHARLLPRTSDLVPPFVPPYPSLRPSHSVPLVSRLETNPQLKRLDM